jgi:WD40 repeat protein
VASTPKPKEVIKSPERIPEVTSTPTHESKPVTPKIVPQKPPPKLTETIKLENLSPDQILTLTEVPRGAKITKTLFSHRGLSVLASDSSGASFVWKWKTDKSLPDVTSDKVLQFNSKWATTDNLYIVQILCLSTNDSFLVSSSGGNLELFNNINRQKMTTLYEPADQSSLPTAFAFNPSDNNFFAIGLHNGNIILKSLKQKKSGRDLVIIKRQ